MTKDERQDATVIGCFAVSIVIVLTMVGTFYYGIYHLLDKLIDKL